VIEEEALKERSAEIRAIVPVEVATYLLNEKREAIRDIEKRNDLRVVVIPNLNLETPHFEVTRLRDDEAANQAAMPSYKIETDTSVLEEASKASTPIAKQEQPAVQRVSVAPQEPAPMRIAAEAAPAATPATEGIVTRLWKSLFGTTETEVVPEEEEENKPARRNNRQRSNRGGQNRNRGNQRNNRNKDQRKQADESAEKESSRPSNNRNRPRKDTEGDQPERSNQRSQEPREKNTGRNKDGRKRKPRSERTRPEAEVDGNRADANGNENPDRPKRRPSDSKPRAASPKKRQNRREAPVTAETATDLISDKSLDQDSLLEQTSSGNSAGTAASVAAIATGAAVSAVVNDTDAKPAQEQPHQSSEDSLNAVEAKVEQISATETPKEAAPETAGKPPTPAKSAPVARVPKPEPAAAPAPSVDYSTIGRATNDPRDKPKVQAEFAISTKQIELVDLQAPALEAPELSEHDVQQMRASNDPRKKASPENVAS